MQTDEEQYDSPNGSEWVVAVDKWGMVTILKTPTFITACLTPVTLRKLVCRLK